MTNFRRFQIASTVCCFLPAAVLSGPANGGDFCTDVTTLNARAEVGFFRGSGTGALRALPGTKECGLSDNLNGSRSFHCMWEYGYRNPEAYDAFGEMNRMLKECLGEYATARRDQPVNHPDYYEQVMFQSGDVEISLSIKDKSALQKTFAFLRIQAGIPN